MKLSGVMHVQHAVMQQKEARAERVACDAMLHIAAVKHQNSGQGRHSVVYAKLHSSHQASAATLLPTCRAQPCDLCKSLNCGAHYVWLIPYTMVLKQVCQIVDDNGTF